MNTKDQITKQLNDEYEAFFHTRYEGKVAPPKNILELFERAIRLMPPYAHKMNFYRVRSIAKTKYEDLTNSDLQDIVKVTLNTPLEQIHEGVTPFMDLIEKHIEFEKF